MKKIIIFILPLLLCGCTHDMNRREIDEINLVLTLGIDYTEGEYVLSALYSTGGGADPEKGAGAGEEHVSKGKGKTAFEALEDLKSKDKKAISLAQTGAFLIGEGAAQKGLKQTLDFLSRDETIKMEALIYIIKNENASDFIKDAIDKKITVHEDLQALEQKQKEAVTRNDNTVVNILNDTKLSNCCVLIPYLTAEDTGLFMDGYAVFDELQLEDYLDHETSDGVNFIKNIMRSYPIYLKDEVGLQISYTKTKLNTNIKNKGITVTIRVDFETMIKEITTQRDIFTQKELLRLTQQQNHYIKAILEKAVNYSIATRRDILSIARLVENQNQVEWKEIENNWKEEIPNINYVYEVRSQITKSFILGSEK